MANMHASVARFFARFSEELAHRLDTTQSATTEVTWNSLDLSPLTAELQWWKGTISGDLGSTYFGGDPNAWAALEAADELGNLAEAPLPWLEQSLQTALEDHLGSLTLAGNSRPPEAPSEDWTRVAVDIKRDGKFYALLCLLSPPLVAALEKKDAAPAGKPSSTENPEMKSNSAALSPNGILMHVEVPVSISFGRTRIAMRELLSLNSGSILELDQALGDWVELRVNNHVIALGEVVAVDGNYGVRIMELVSEQPVPAGNERTK